MIFYKGKIMLRGLYRGTLDILYDSHNSARIKMNTHIRSFDANSQQHTFIKDTIIGFWRMIFEILLNLYLVFTLSMVTALILCTVVIAWPITFLMVSFTAAAEHVYDERSLQKQVELELAQQKTKTDEITETTKSKK
jgi:hypothetical protein